MILDKNQINASVRGSSILSTGGGGSIKDAFILTQKIDSVKLIKLDDLMSDDYIFTVFAVGSISNDDNIEPFIENIIKAKNGLEKYLNIKFRGIVPVEIGPCSIAETFYISSLTGIPVVDSDIVGGRCSPEIFLETISLNPDIKRSPLICVTKTSFSDVINDSDAFRLENLFREISCNEKSYVYVVGYPMKIKDIFSLLNKNSLSTCISIGLSKNISEILKLTDGVLSFYGNIVSIDKSENLGFLEGDISIKGLGEFSERKMKIYFKNENLISWINEDIVTTCPDLISILDENNIGINNADIKEGQNVSILAIPSIDLWRSPNGLKLFSPRLFGFNIDYKPIKLDSDSYE